MSADLRHIRGVVARSKKGTREQREKARKELHWLAQDFPQYFHNGYFRDPKDVKAKDAPIITYRPIGPEDEEAIINCIDEMLSDIGVAKLVADLEAAETPFLHSQIDDFAKRLRLETGDPGLKKLVVEHLPKILLGERQAATLAKLADMRRDLTWEALERATPFLDERDRGPKNWKVSEILKIHYCIMCTKDAATHAEKRAHKAEAQKLTDARLAEARRRYAAGYYADPTIDPPIPRPGARQVEP